MNVEVYVFGDEDGEDYGSFMTRDIEEARRYARENRLRIIARVFEYVDSEPVEDYTGATEDDVEEEEPEADSAD